MPLQSSKGMSVGKSIRVFRNRDLSLDSSVRTQDQAVKTWVRLINAPGHPGGASGPIPVAGTNPTQSWENYSELLVFAVAGGGGGGGRGDDDMGGGGGGGAGQFDGYPIPITNPGGYTYSIPGGGAAGSYPPSGGDGATAAALTIVETGPGTTVFTLTGGGGAPTTPNNYQPSGGTGGSSYGTGATQPPYGSHGGGNGSVQAGRYVNNRCGFGTDGDFGGAGGGGAGSPSVNDYSGQGTNASVNVPGSILRPGSHPTAPSALVPNAAATNCAGESGRINTYGPTTYTVWGGSPLDNSLQIKGVAGANGGAGSPVGQAGALAPATEATPNYPTAPGAGGGTGGGIEWNGTGDTGYGGGGGGGQPGGNGGAGYLVVYIR